MPDMAAEVPQKFEERRKDVALEAAHVTQEAINFFDAKLLVKKGLDFFIRGWRSRLAEFVGDPLCELASRANYDGLTGLLNQRALISRLNTEIKETIRYKRPLTVVMIDMNGFKAVNDSCGHQFGDLVLKAVAETMNTAVRETDFLARYGGDEFCLVLPETALEKALPLVLRILEAINKYRGMFGFQEITIGASLGISSFNGKLMINSTDLLNQADECLYKAKNLGKEVVRQEWLLGSVAYRNDEGKIVIEHYKRGEVGPMFEEPTIISE